jgi:hypothetical protein
MLLPLLLVLSGCKDSGPPPPSADAFLRNPQQLEATIVKCVNAMNTGWLAKLYVSRECENAFEANAMSIQRGSPVATVPPPKRVAKPVATASSALKQKCSYVGATATADPSAPKFVGGVTSLQSGDHNGAIVRVATMNCYAAVSASEFCQPETRAMIAAYADRFLQVRRDMTSGAANARMEADAQRIWRSPKGLAADAALEGHFKAGRLRSRDFGWSPAADVSTLLKKYESAPDGCAGHAG